MELDSAETEYLLFSNRSREAIWQASLQTSSMPIQSSITPRLIGIFFDRNVNFGKHVEKARSRLRSRLAIMRAISHKNWGVAEERPESTLHRVCEISG